MKIETSRLVIRSYETTDMDDAAEFLLNKKTMAFIPERFSSKEEMTLFLEKNKNHFFPVVLKEEDKVIGHLSFEAFFGNHSYEIGWVFNEDYHQKGYGKEAAKAMLNEGFTQMNIHRIIATCQPENPGSWKLMEAIGMRREGFFKKCIPAGDSWWDEYYYAVLREEWK